jgi:iron complex outermembrane receptor protein
MSLIDRRKAASRKVAVAAIGLAVAAAHAEEPTLGSADLEERGITTLDGVAGAVPEISFAPMLNSLTTLRMYMRGAGPVAPGQITLDGAVGLYQDGFYIARLQANSFDLLDLERVAVLAGPQGASYGRNTVGGVVSVTSQAPSGKLGFHQDVAFGSRNSYRILSSLDAPSWHGLAAKVTLLASSIDGYVKNQEANSHDYGSERQRAARLQLSWNPLTAFRADYFLERVALDSTAQYDSNPTLNGETLFANHTYYADPNGPMRSTYRPVDLPLSTSNHTAQGLTLAWHGLTALNVESRTGYRTMDALEQQDFAEFYGAPVGTVDRYEHQQFSQDLQFSGDLFEREIAYVAGASYFKEKGNHSDEFLLLSYFPGLPARGSQQTQVAAETRSQAYYARLSWRPALLHRHLELSAAGRYTKDRKDAVRWITQDNTDVVEADVRNHLSYGRSTPEYSLTYYWTDSINTYVKWATAYQAGGALETAPVGELSTATLRPESSTTYEVGLRSSAFGGRLRADIAVFDTKRKDVQYALPVDLVTDDVLDFQRVTVRGASLDFHVAPMADLALSASTVYLRWSIDRVDALAGTTFDPTVTQGSPYVVGQNINNLFVLPYTPRYSAAVAGDYTFVHLDRRDLLVHLDYVYRARMFAEAGAGPGMPGAQFDTQQAHGLLNARITLSEETDWSHRVKVSVWGRNILNRKYYQPAIGAGAGLTSFDSSGTPVGYTARIGAWAEPATYGLAIRYEY